MLNHHRMIFSRCHAIFFLLNVGGGGGGRSRAMALRVYYLDPPLRVIQHVPLYKMPNKCKYAGNCEGEYNHLHQYDIMT